MGVAEYNHKMKIRGFGTLLFGLVLCELISCRPATKSQMENHDQGIVEENEMVDYRNKMEGGEGEEQVEEMKSQPDQSNAQNDELASNKEGKPILSNFEISLIRCCSTFNDAFFGRCFEINGFGGLNFAVNPCRYLREVIEKLE